MREFHRLTIAMFVLAAAGSAAAQDSMNGTSRLQRPQLSVSYTLNIKGDAEAVAEIRNGFGSGFALTAALVENGQARPETTTVIGSAPIDADGYGSLSFTIPEAASMSTTEFLLRAQVGSALRPGSRPSAAGWPSWCTGFSRMAGFAWTG